MDRIPSKEDIETIHERIASYIHRTPIFQSRLLNQIAGCEIFFKCENFQKIGAFKIRGALSSAFSLSKDELKNGIGTHSSGNHAAAVTLAAKMLDTKAYIVMPHTAPKVKIDAVKGYGGEITFSEPTMESRQQKMQGVIERTGALLIHSYDNYNIIKGQATAAKEIYEEEKGFDFIITPVGGGGLLSGTALSSKYLSPGTKVIGAEPKGADDAFRSLRDGKIHPSVKPNTIADGLLTSLSERTFGVIRSYVDEIITVSDESIIRAMRLIWERMKIIVEPSSAITLAAIMENKEKFVNSKTAAILTGGNVDLEKLPWQS